jgi:hypothetical protein
MPAMQLVRMEVSVFWLHPLTSACHKRTGLPELMQAIRTAQSHEPACTLHRRYWVAEYASVSGYTHHYRTHIVNTQRTCAVTYALAVDPTR